MIYVGIDIAKLNHFASAISSDGEELIKPFKFTNDNDGFHLLISKLDPLDKDSLIICCIRISIQTIGAYRLQQLLQCQHFTIGMATTMV